MKRGSDSTATYLTSICCVYTEKIIKMPISPLLLRYSTQTEIIQLNLILILQILQYIYI